MTKEEILQALRSGKVDRAKLRDMIDSIRERSESTSVANANQQKYYNPDVDLAPEVKAPSGEIEPSVKTEKAPSKFNGSQRKMKTAMEGYQKGSVPMSGYLNEVGKKGLPYAVGAAFGPAGLISVMGGQAVDMGVNAATKGEKDSWGDLFADPEKHPVWNSMWEFTNPGYFAVAPVESGWNVAQREAARDVWTKALDDRQFLSDIMVGAPRKTKKLVGNAPEDYLATDAWRGYLIDGDVPQVKRLAKEEIARRNKRVLKEIDFYAAQDPEVIKALENGEYTINYARNHGLLKKGKNGKTGRRKPIVDPIEWDSAKYYATQDESQIRGRVIDDNIIRPWSMTLTEDIGPIADNIRAMQKVRDRTYGMMMDARKSGKALIPGSDGSLPPGSVASSDPIKPAMWMENNSRVRYIDNSYQDLNANRIVIGLRQDGPFPGFSTLSSRDGLHPKLVETIAHETAHQNPAFNTRKPYNYNPDSPWYGNDYSWIPDEYRKAFREGVHFQNNHDFELAENYADLFGVRSMLDYYGINDGSRPYTQSDLDKLTKRAVFDPFFWRENSKKKYFEPRYLRYGHKDPVSDLNTIYANGGTLLHKYDGGGNTTRRASRYITILPDNDEAKFQEWYQRYALNHNLDPNPDAREHYYDYRGYWNSNRANPDLELGLSGDHFPDTWKMPGHPTFSVDSVYAKYAPEIAGKWVNGKYVKPDMFDADTMKLRQRYAESSFRDDLRSPAGAIGRYQIMPATYKEYVDRTGNKGDLLDPKYNEALRDWYLETRLPQFEAVKRGNPSGLIREYRKYAAYNMGPGALNRALTRAQKAGVDIDNSTDWIKYLPKETRDYVDFIVGGKDVADTSKTNALYQKALAGAGLRADGGKITVFSPLADFRASHPMTLPKPALRVKKEGFQGFGGGEFGGAGVSGYWDVSIDPLVASQYVRNTPIMGERSFSDAYAEARKAGLPDFMFNGQRYTTDYDPNAKLGSRKYEPAAVLNIREVLDENKKPIADSTRIEPWLGQIPGVHERKKGGGIHIKPSRRGTFRAQATKMGMSVKEAASHILAHKENYSPEMVRKAVFAHNFAGDGGLIERYGSGKIREAINKIKRG